MKTVTTLCATASVTAATAFGCTFAEPHTAPSSSSTPGNVDLSRVAARLNGRVRRESRTPATPPLAHLFESAQSPDLRHTQQCPLGTTATLNMLSPSSNSTPNTSTNTRAPSRSSSWIRRLSSLSPNISAPGSPRGSSPSTTSSSTSRSRNKLVKRSSIPDVVGFTPKKSTKTGLALIYPATTHRRAELRLRSQSMDARRSFDPCTPPHGWKQYFTSRTVKVAGRAVKRVVQGTVPTLVLARDVPKDDGVCEETVECENLEWNAVWDDESQPSSSASGSPVIQGDDGERPISGPTSPRRSFSIRELLHSPWPRQTQSFHHRPYSRSTVETARRTPNSLSPQNSITSSGSPPNELGTPSPPPLVSMFLSFQDPPIRVEGSDDSSLSCGPTPLTSLAPCCIPSFEPVCSPSTTSSRPNSRPGSNSTSQVIPAHPSSVLPAVDVQFSPPADASASFATVNSTTFTNTTNTTATGPWLFSDSETFTHSDFSPSSPVQSEFPPSSPPQCWPQSASSRKSAPPIHARSQSLPVVQGASRSAAGKFGTWGVGCTVVSEDWDDDFVFEEEEGSECAGEDSRADSGLAMIVPPAIRAQQSAVRANIGLLREWGLLIEDLKALREKAADAGLPITGDVWAEADAMIELADHEPEGPPLQWSTPPSSPSLDLDGFDDPSPSPSDRRRRRQPRKSVLQNADIFSDPASPSSAENERTGRCALGAVSPGLGSPSPITPAKGTPFPSLPFSNISSPAGSSPSLGPAFTFTPGSSSRPRKDSEAIARSVIQALQKRGPRGNLSSSVASTSTPAGPLQLGKPAISLTGVTNDEHTPDFGISKTAPPSPSKKVPFDTATLKHIVPYLGGLVATVRKIVEDENQQHKQRGDDAGDDDGDDGEEQEHHDGPPSWNKRTPDLTPSATQSIAHSHMISGPSAPTSDTSTSLSISTVSTASLSSAGSGSGSVASSRPGDVVSRVGLLAI